MAPDKTALDFIDFVNASPTPYHACANAAARLEKAGFSKIKERDSWASTLRPGGQYYLTRNGSSIVAFAIGKKWRPGNPVGMIGAHTDSPCLRIKPVSKKGNNGFLQVGVETYGGGIWHSWFDRDLSIAGRVLVKDSTGTFTQKLIKVDKPLLRIPTLAIHLDRSSSFDPNKEVELFPIAGLASAELNKSASETQVEGNEETEEDFKPLRDLTERHHPHIIDVIASHAEVDVSNVVDFELVLYDTQPACLGGLNDEFVFSPRLDNLGMTYCSIMGLITSLRDSAALDEDHTIRLVTCFDHEEIGSTSAQGANSNLLPAILRRLSVLPAGRSDTASDASYDSEFERSRIFRPRFLISGVSGMGQSYLSSALLHYFEGVHVQNFGLPNLLADGRPMEQVIVGQFTEVKRHKPSVIYIPNIDVWFMGISDVALVTFKAMLKSIPPTDPVLVLATAEHEEGEPIPPELLRDIFGFSRKNRLEIARPKKENRREYFSTIIEHIRKSPTDFPDPTNRKKRVLEELPVAPPPPPKVLSREEIKAQQKKDHQMLNILKVLLQPIMDQINRKYKKFRQPVIPSHLLEHLFLETDPDYIRPDLAEGEVRPYEIVKDKDGTDILRETATGKTFYNLETTTIEERLSNGFYCRPQDFYRDIKTLAKDSRAIGDKERTLKANEIVTNVDVDVAGVIQQTAHIDWDALKHRQIERAKLAADKERKRRAMQSIVDRVQSDAAAAGNDSDSQGPVVLGEPIPGSRHTTTRFQPMSPLRTTDATGSDLHSHSNGNTKPSRLSDVQMGGVDDDTQPVYEPHVMKPPAPEWLRTDHTTTTSSAMATAGNTQLSQRSVVTTVPPGVSPSALLNDASTTKTSDPSDRSSSKWSTQHTNGYHADQNARMDDSQLPDTQIPPGGGGSQLGDDQWQHSQLDALHRPSDGPATQPSQVNSTPSAAQKSQAISLGNILNDSPTNDHIRNSGSSSSQQQVVIHESRVEALHDELTSRTSGCTIEQLEQINRELMDEVWKTRGDWNRMTVLGCVTRVFNDTIKDIEDIQGLLQQSQE
ncbi:Aspartyl aminopeptidase like protein [Verticillium longisporum]|nr:Aspartyl aminopeptidase like protein [Verticillium longisporum]